ncbi:lipase member H-like [Hyposmocoma kahamanoa]|uniref:lipase member H-like n=1 Tax=Hyposmocoma kahamanoa TaxID=1477025 RepID=UPI000E6D933A|nr:lipase member H-like [Hyposmocoma kahamanoa]
MKFEMLIKFLLACGVIEVILAVQDTGYPAGFMADCPGMNRSTTFSERTKKSLSVVVMWPSKSLFSSSERRCKLSVEGAACAAEYLDFKRRKTQVMISGYMDASFSPLMRMMSRTYVTLGRNVIMVEIFPILVRTYPVAARITKPLGHIIGEFLAELTRLGLSPNRIEMVGGSLGAHIASFASIKYRELTGKRPERLTALDPAGPCFRNLPETERFQADAAIHTDALHTNIDGFGIADAIAHVDFYANGGEYQPSMTGNFILPCFLVCSHVRAAFYWNLAYKNTDKFVGVRCDSVASVRHGRCYDGIIETNYLGPKTNFSKPGIYYLPTTEFVPYFVEDGTKSRDYGVNNYLLKTAPDEDLIV